MARPLRYEAAGAVYHVMARGDGGVCVEVLGVGSRTGTFRLWTGGIVNAERAIANLEKNGAFPGDVKWNFGKFLIGKDGKAIARFEPGQKPDSPEIVSAIEKALEH